MGVYYLWFDASDDEDKESCGAFAAAISSKKNREDLSEDADKESLHLLVRKLCIP